MVDGLLHLSYQISQCPYGESRPDAVVGIGEDTFGVQWEKGRIGAYRAAMVARTLTRREYVVNHGNCDDFRDN